MMSHYVTPEMMEEFTRRMKNPRPMTEEQKAKMAELERKFKALSPEEREDLRKRVAADDPFN